MATLVFFAGFTQVHLLGAVLFVTVEVQRAHPLSKPERPLIVKQGLLPLLCCPSGRREALFTVPSSFLVREAMPFL